MKRFAPVRTEEYITGKQHIVLSAHLNCSLGRFLERVWVAVARFVTADGGMRRLWKFSVRYGFFFNVQ